MAQKSTQNQDVDPQTLHESREMWVNFTHLVKYSTIIVLVVLSLMALLLV